jgi:hypothetical protein
MTQALIVPSTMTPREFGVIFSRLATQLQWRDADVSSAASYYEALKNYTLDTIHESGKRLAMEQGRRFFPTTGEWAEVADAVQHEALRRAVKPARDEPWHFDCESCEDTGWAPHQCDGGAAAWPEAAGASDDIGNRPFSYKALGRLTETPGPSTCGRRKAHAPHDYVTVCPCRPTNRTWIRHRSFGVGE